MSAWGYIAVEGLIGAGKTTLVQRLAAERDAALVLEEFADNPFLPRFYDQPERFAFSVELSFLAQRWHQLKRTGERSLFQPLTVADYSIGKSLVFASVTLPPDELALFRDLYDIMYGGLPRPDLLVYLHLPLETVRRRILQRGRDYERRIPVEYLERLQERYLDHLRQLGPQRVLVVDVGEADLMHDPAAFRRFSELIDAEVPPGHHLATL